MRNLLGLIPFLIFSSMAAVTNASDQSLWSITPVFSPELNPNYHTAHQVVIDEEVITGLSEGGRISLPLPSPLTTSYFYIQTINVHDEVKEIAGYLVGRQTQSTVYLRYDGNGLQGHIYDEDLEVGLRFSYTDDNILYSMAIDQIICLDYGVDVGEEVTSKLNAASLLDSYSSPDTYGLYALQAVNLVPSYESLPGSEYVLYIDFDGEVVDGYWATKNNGDPIDAAPFSLDSSPATFNADEVQYINRVWKGVSEDYSMYDVNVTTDRAVYDAASIHKRAQSIVTPTCTWYKTCSSHGVGAFPQFGAYAGCSTTCGDYSPSWVWPFNNLGAPRHEAHYVSGAISHEFGHGFWLVHDSIMHPSGYVSEYYSGNSEWYPIMGAQVNVTAISTWSKGEYIGAYNRLNREQDDIVDISQHLNFRYEQNEASSGEGTHQGIIGSFDTDDYRFFAKPTDTINISANGINDDLSNLDVRLQLYSPSGSLVVDANPTSSLNASLTHSPIEQGLYEIVVSGVGSATPNSYVRYGSIGQYTLNLSRNKVNPDPANIVPILYLLLLNDE